MLTLMAAVAFLMVLAVIGGAAYGVALFNSLIQVKHNVDQAWANIEVLLKQRSDELGKLIDAVRAYMQYERDLLTRLTTLRTEVARGGSDAARLQAEKELGAAAVRLFAVAENYPVLKTSDTFLQLQQRISDLETQVGHRREYYNDAVNINNVRMEEFPDRLLVPIAGLQRRPLFEATPQERADVDVGARLRA